MAREEMARGRMPAQATLSVSFYESSIELRRSIWW